MFIGLDYGTSHCAVTAPTAQGLISIPLENNQAFLPSCIYTPERCLISDFVAQSIAPDTAFSLPRQAVLRQVAEAKLALDISSSSEVLLFGNAALEQHMLDPAEGYFIKSPKSFLGASGLRPEMVAFFEDVVTAMLIKIKRTCEDFLQSEITGAVIGRPVNFQGINAEVSNQQAQAILLTAATRAGFQQVEFLFEPLAAGFDFERTLKKDTQVLVVDIGGGTSDCSMVRMGPSHKEQLNRKQDFLAHTGERIGGNDFDIRLALEALMPHFGMHSSLKNNLPMPIMPFVHATAVNDVAAQASFYSEKMQYTLDQLYRDTRQPHLLSRLINLRTNKQNFAVVRKAELTKIALSSQQSTYTDLSQYTPELIVEVSQGHFFQAAEPLLEKILHLVDEAIKHAQTLPETVYLTGGSAKSALIKQALHKRLGADIPLIEGDHFGSVVSGLGIWADKLAKSTQ